MKKILLCLCLFSSAAYANQCEIIDSELAASYSEMETYGNYNEKNEEKYQSSEKRFKDALAKIEKLEGKFCTWEKAPEVGVGMLTSEDQKLQILVWDWQSGGTMHEYGSIWRYQLPNGTWKTEVNELSSFITRLVPLKLNGKPYYYIETSDIYSQCHHAIAAKFYQITEKGLEEANLIQGKKPTSNIEVSFISYTNNDLPESNAYFDYDLKNNRFSFPLVHQFEDTCGNGKMTSERIYYRFYGKLFVKEKKAKK